jgi:hypothetical protein
MRAHIQQLWRECDPWRWFEEGVVLPWTARKEKTRKALKAMGLGPKNFPSPHATKVPAKATSNRSVAPQSQKQKAKKTTKEQPDDGPIPESEIATQDTFTCSYVNRDTYNSEPRESDSTTQLHQFRDRYEFEDVEIGFTVGNFDSSSLDERVRTAMNTFANANDRVVYISCDGKQYPVNGAALFEHCGFLRNHFADLDSCKGLDMHGRSAVIVKAFIQAISPCSKSSLPVYDIEFASTTSIPGADCKDTLGVLDGAHCKARRIVWDMEACCAIHDLAMAMDCSIVKDMIVDHVFAAHAEEHRKKNKGLASQGRCFELPFYYVNHLSSPKDAPFIHMIADVHVHRNVPGYLSSIVWPEEINNHAYNIIEEWIYDSREAFEPIVTEKGYCQRYHTHGDDETCYKRAARQSPMETQRMISELLTGFRQKGSEVYKKALADLEAQDPHDQQAEETQHIQAEVIQWSLQKDELAARTLEIIDEHKRSIAVGQASGVDTKKWRKSLKYLLQGLEVLRDDHYW